MKIKEIIQQLQMQPHPEGGYYAETFRHPQTLHLPNGNERNLFTTIYFLLTETNKSHFHRIKSDETWFFHSGATIELLCFQHKNLIKHRLGNNLAAGEIPQLHIPANTWFAAHLPSQKGYGLVSCTVSPGFDFADFELATQQQFEQQGLPIHEEIRKFIL